jgi:hypothetical protein
MAGNAQETTMPTTNITALVEEFAKGIVAAAKATVTARIDAALATAFGAPKKRKPGRPPKQAVAGVAPVAGKKAARKKAKKVTPKVARARKLQGQYLGALRSLSAADRDKVRAVAKEKGVAEAVKMAAGMKKGK